jgi:hypothetical protein
VLQIHNGAWLHIILFVLMLYSDSLQGTVGRRGLCAAASRRLISTTSALCLCTSLGFIKDNASE